ncbi:cellulose-binding protein [Streptomyces sp. ACA25]|uniref:cellulose-binding protein n=1 Tax=Streptomyces sp. ACA25 TaxID=3022596 RepID=UPI00230734D9|nr:cellulose-binding protein [Streptomyces sp. ACA25]MDB1087233.1 cellulose-binding protein [Streptomyces sp. ACA25]
MTSATSPHGFLRVRRGRGYRPEQADAHLAALGEERDRALERLARLTVLAKEMSQKAEQLSKEAASLPPARFESLGPRAQLLLTESVAEAGAIREAGEAVAQEIQERAGAEVRELREAARLEADRRIAAARAAADSVLDAARARAEALRTEAQEYARAQRAEAEQALAEVTRRCGSVDIGWTEEQTAAFKSLEEEITRGEAAAEERIAELEHHADTVLAEAEQKLADAQEIHRNQEEDTEARAHELLLQARVREQQVERETERIVREHAERAEEIREHMAHVRSSLSALTGRTLPSQSTGPESDRE